MIVQSSPNNVPSRLIYELLEACNYRCVHCFVPHRPGMPKMEDVIRVLSGAISEGVPSISWTGGEPYLRKDLFEIAESLPVGDVVHTINTNGSLITPSVAQKTSHHFALARVSIFGDSTTYFDNIKIKSRKFDYSTAFNAISLFLDAGMKVQVNVPVISKNGTDIPEVMDDLERSFGSNLEEIVLIPVTKVGPIESSEFPFPEAEMAKVLQEQFQSVSSSPVRLFVWKPGKHMLIKANNYAYAHPVVGTLDGALKIGSALEETIQQLWARFPEEFVQAHRELTPSVDHLKLEK